MFVRLTVFGDSGILLSRSAASFPACMHPLYLLKVSYHCAAKLLPVIVRFYTHPLTLMLLVHLVEDYGSTGSFKRLIHKVCKVWATQIISDGLTTISLIPAAWLTSDATDCKHEAYVYRQTLQHQRNPIQVPHTATPENKKPLC